MRSEPAGGRYSIYASICLFSLLSATLTTVNAEKKTAAKVQEVTAQKKSTFLTITRLQEGTGLQLPRDFRLKKPQRLVFQGDDFKVRLYASDFKQGDIVYLEILPLQQSAFEPESNFDVRLADRKVYLTRRDWGFRGLSSIPPWRKSGRAGVQIIAGKTGKKYSFPFTVRPGKFRVFRSSMDLGRYSNSEYLKRKPKIIEWIRRGTALKKKAFAHWSSDALRGRLAHPRDAHKITSPFFARRVTSRYVIRRGRKKFLKPRVSRHGGVDLKGPWGTPVYALADGQAVIARKLYFEGNFILIDHGQGIFSAYMHLGKIAIAEGDNVAAGDKIGIVGSTGMVTGPHLHLGLTIQGVKANPLSLLSLPIRD